MTKSTNTKKALALSVLSMLVCAVMFVGSTFAWFTDTASADINKIQSGTLGIQLLNEAGENVEGTTLAWVKAARHEGEEILWEPGCTYELPAVKIKNNGNLALKYKIVIDGVAGDAKLLEAIDFTYKIGDAVLDLSAEGRLAAGAQTELIKISGHMKETAGNEYQNKKIEGVSIKVVAAQDTVEFDSSSDQYDADSLYQPLNAAELKNALEAGGSVVMADDIAVSPECAVPDYRGLVPQINVTKDTIMDISGKTLSVADYQGQEWTYTPALIAVYEGSTMTINGDGVVNAEAGDNNSYGININGGNLIINGGSYYGAITAVQVQKGSLVINGGFFDMAPSAKAAAPELVKFLINCKDSAYKDGTATVEIKGGTFVNFDPSNNLAEGPNTNFVAAGYKVVPEQHGEDTWYKVVAE